MPWVILTTGKITGIKHVSPGFPSAEAAQERVRQGLLNGIGHHLHHEVVRASKAESSIDYGPERVEPIDYRPKRRRAVAGKGSARSRGGR